MADRQSPTRRGGTPRTRHRDPADQGEPGPSLLQDHRGGAGRATAELASIVAALAAVMERTSDDPFLPELCKRAQALAGRLR